jgi:hypothetical protein
MITIHIAENDSRKYELVRRTKNVKNKETTFLNSIIVNAVKYLLHYF